MKRVELCIESSVINVYVIFGKPALPAVGRPRLSEMKMLAAFQDLNRHSIDQWWEAETSFPDLGTQYTDQSQTKNEKSLLQVLEEVEHTLSNPPRNREDAQSVKMRLGAAFRWLAEETLSFTADQLDPLPAESFSTVTEEFVRQARAFDHRLSAEEIYQAERNAWTAHGLQWLLGRPVELSPAILAYSLLYPYTDNYLDDPEITSVNKQAFNQRFRRRLDGEQLSGANAREKTIFALVGMIEKQYPRIDHPVVIESLLGIHDAQCQSLDLLRPSAAQKDVDVLGLSLYKGGTSVLADGYLAAGSLSAMQRRYCYGHGALAQLLDDMEDIEQDGRAGRLTVYTQAAGQGPLDALANRTFHFGRRILMGLDCFETAEPVREAIRRGADLLFVEAIGRTGRFYTPAYLRQLETHFPFRFSFLKEQRDQFIRRHGSSEKLMGTILLFGK